MGHSRESKQLLSTRCESSASRPRKSSREPNTRSDRIRFPFHVFGVCYGHSPHLGPSGTTLMSNRSGSSLRSLSMCSMLIIHPPSCSTAHCRTSGSVRPDHAYPRTSDIALDARSRDDTTVSLGSSSALVVSCTRWESCALGPRQSQRWR